MQVRAPRGLLAALAGGVLAVSVVLPVSAQTAGSSSLFQQVVPRPSGKNGYEELVQACDRLRSSRAFERAAEPELSLSDARLILADRRVSEALTLLRTGLAKPIASPRQTITAATPLPELPEFRQVARLLRLQQRVLIADGRNSDAVVSFRTGIQLSRAIQLETFAAGEMGIEILGTQADSIGEWLEQLSARDCDQLYRLCLDELRQPDPTPALLDGERRFAQATVAELTEAIRRGGVAGIQQALGLTDEQIKPASLFLQALAANPQGLSNLATQLGQGIDELHRREVEQLQKPAWQRSRVDPNVGGPGNAITNYAIQKLIPQMSDSLETFVKREAYLRLIACHCAVRRYRWEHNRLPESLSELPLGELATDPFTGEPLQYAAKKKRYAIWSAGRHTDANDLAAVNGRHPLAIGSDE